VKFDIPDDLQKLIGRSCCQARLICNELALSFGKKIKHQFENQNVELREWEISSGTSAWRLIKSNKIVCGSYDDDVSCLNSLVNKTLIDIRQTSHFDVSLYFNNGYEVCFLAQSQSRDSLNIIVHDQYIAFVPGNKWVSRSSEVPLELSEEDRVYCIHSEQCFKRWGKVVNVVPENQCLSCAYFIPLRGSFYFGDFGLCSNRVSPFDGRVVGMSSGCKVWGGNIEICHESKDDLSGSI